MTTSPTITLTCSYSICSGHRLYRPDWTSEKNRQVFGKCANNHGHQYKIDIVISGPLSPDTGMLINGYDVDSIVKPAVIAPLDHHFLNDDVAFFKDHQPTAEWIAIWIFDTLKGQFPLPVTLSKVRVYETPELITEYPAV